MRDYGNTRWIFIIIKTASTGNEECTICLQESDEGMELAVHPSGLDNFFSEKLKLTDEYRYNDKWYDAESYKALKDKLFPNGKIEK